MRGHIILPVLVVALATVTSAGLAVAQTPAPGSVLTLEEAISAGQASSPTSVAAAAGRDVVEAQRRLARLRPNPSLDVVAENVGGSGAYRGLDVTETTLSLAVPIERGGKRSARIAVAEAQGGRAQLGAVVAAADLRLTVTQAYNEAIAAVRRVANARQQVGIAAEGLRVARARVRAGRASPLEEQRADLARINAEGAAERAQRTAEAASLRLSGLTRTAPATLDQDWFSRIGDIGPERPIYAEGTLAAVAAGTDVAIADAQVRLARSQRVPDVTVSAGVRRLNATNDVAGVFGISVPLPLFSSGRAGVDVASAQRAQLDALRRVAVLDAERQILAARAELGNAATTARAATGPALVTAIEAARIARIGYREGKFGQLDLLEAERALAETRASAIDALAALHDARARLERLTTTAPSPSPSPRRPR
ncbi:Transporter [Sphingomonas antarctica]|uniref:TolC family protein n=1 Tax=Sphingomonas antarctica TaxID=2040274 RepID=UPI0039E85A21